MARKSHRLRVDVRERMATTGETWTTALRAVIAERVVEEEERRAAEAAVLDEPLREDEDES